MGRPTKYSPVCSIPDCGRKHNAKGYCLMHYVRFRKHGDALCLKRQVNNNPPEKCTIKGCNKPHEAKGFCNYHYVLQRKIGTSNKIKCLIEGCGIGVYAKGYCFSHYQKNRYCGNPIGIHEINREKLKNSSCSVQGCNEPAVVISRGKYKKAYCKFHHNRKNAGIKRPLKSPKGIKGELNPRWNGGVSDYPNHSEFKRARKRVLEKANYKCSHCGSYANETHHKDGTKHNHADENLEPLCHKCHTSIYHSGKRNNSKYAKIYGANLTDMAKQLGCSAATVSNLHTKGILHERIQSAQLITV